MTENIWTRYADRRPTKEDADADGFVYALGLDGYMRTRHVEDAAWRIDPLPWARPADVLRATGYVKPRKLHSAWRELRADSWSDRRMVYVLDLGGTVERTGGPFSYTTAIALGNYWTHWQPCDPPKVWEDE